MFSEFSYRKKNKWLLVLLIPLTLFIYSFALKRTFVLRSQVNEMEEKIAAASDAPQRSLQLQAEISKLENFISVKKTKENEPGQSLLEFVTGFCKDEGTVLREFPAASLAEKGDFIIETNKITVQGNYLSLLSLVHLLEEANLKANVASVDYSLGKDPVTKEQILTATIYMQTITKK